MESSSAVNALSALAQESRLAVFRTLVQAGAGGVAAGDLAQRLEVPANTLSFHLKILSQAGLVQGRQDGRFVFYSANYEAMNRLVGFLTENCCGGLVSCAPGSAVATPESRRRRPA